MAWTLVASDAVGFADGGTGHLYALPSGAPSAGDLDVIGVNSDTVVSTPSGFTLARSVVNSQGAYLYYRYATGGEGSTVTVTTSGNHPAVLGWQRWRGGLGFEVSVEAHADGSANTTTPAVSTGTLAGAGRLVVAYAALHSLGGAAPTTPIWSSGFTDSGATASNGSGGTGVALFLGSKSNAGTAAESPNVSWTNSMFDRYLLVGVFTPAAGGSTVQASATLSGASALTGTAVTIGAAGATLSGAALLTGTAVRQVFGAVTLSGASTLAATATRITPASAALSAASTVTATGAAARFASTALSGASVLTAPAVAVGVASAALAAASDLTAASGGTVNAAATVAGVSALTAAARLIAAGSATLTGSAGLTAVPAAVALAGATLTAASGLTATAGSPHRPARATIHLPPAGTVSYPRVSEVTIP